MGSITTAGASNWREAFEGHPGLAVTPENYELLLAAAVPAPEPEPVPEVVPDPTPEPPSTPPPSLPESSEAPSEPGPVVLKPAPVEDAGG